MGCDCKNIKIGKDVDAVVVGTYDVLKLTFWMKVRIIFDFLQFYFYFVNTAVINFILHDNLEPKIPKRLLRKYNGQ